MLQDTVNTTSRPNRGAFIASIPPLLQHKRDQLEDLVPGLGTRSHLYDFFMNFLDQFYALSFPMRKAESAQPGKRDVLEYAENAKVPIGEQSVV